MFQCDIPIEDLEKINQTEYIDWRLIEGKTVFITGATGLVGYALVSLLLYHNISCDNKITIIALVRDLDKAQARFAGMMSQELQFVVGTVEKTPQIYGRIDYILHGAAPTASAYFVEHPVETINVIVQGTENMLNLAKEKQAKLVFLSSMEVYGASKDEKLLSENIGIDMDSMALRSSYPYAKRMAECLCSAYAHEYGIDVIVLRLAQTFGPGIAKDDQRVFAQFARCVAENKDIVLLTDGSTKRMYLYVMDAVGAILCGALCGKVGEAYNVADKNSYCSIREMAEMVAHKLANDRIRVVMKLDGDVSKYPPSIRLKLDTAKIEQLGWYPAGGAVVCI